MSKTIRCGAAQRYALALIVLATSLAVQTPLRGQSASPKAAAAVPPSDSAGAQAEPKAKGKSAKNAKENGRGQVTTTDVQKDLYVIGPEDFLTLGVLGQNEMNQTLEVRPDGFISVRLVGDVKAAGLTTKQLVDAVTEKLKNFYNSPVVDIQVIKINSKKYYVNGGVRRPGLYPLTAPKTVYEAIIEAGGLSDFAKKTKIYVLRGQTRYPFNYKEVSAGKHLEQNMLLQNGDVITVPD